MKVLYVSGYSRMVLFNKLIARALAEYGCELEVFDWNSVYKLNKFVNILPRSKVEEKINSSLAKRAAEFKPDYIFILKGEPIYMSTLEQLKNETNARLFNWFGDDPWEFPVFSGKVANYYDYFFTYDPYSVDLYRKIGQNNAHHLCYGYDVELTGSLEITESDKAKYSCDVAFIGSHYPKREELLRKIKDKYDVKIWGRGWKNSSCSDVYAGSALYGTDMLKAMKCVKILVNIHKGFEEGVEASGEGLNLRVLEGTACGSFQITNRQADLPNRFEIDSEIVSFDNWQEAEEKIDYYLAHDSERNEIAESGFKRVKKDHTLLQRIDQIFSIMDTRKNGA